MNKTMKRMAGALTLTMMYTALFPVGIHGAQSAAWKQAPNGKRWLLLADGSWPADCWYAVDGELYRFDAQGYVLTGWFQDPGGSWYFLKNDGTRLMNAWKEGGWLDGAGCWHKPGWNKIQNRWQYWNPEGTICTNGWKKISGKWYHFDACGNMDTGLYEENGNAYHLAEDGAMKELEWVDGRFYGEDGVWLPAAASADDGTSGHRSFSFTKDQALRLKNKGALGFYESIGSPDARQAAEIVSQPQGKLQGWTHLGQEGDATSLANLVLAADQLEFYQQLRRQEGLPEQKVTLELMAIAQVQTNYSVLYEHKHSKVYHVAENLTWTNRNPYDLWYWQQKKNKAAGQGEWAHYDNICFSYTHTGLALSQKGNLQAWDGRTGPVPVWGQVFYYRQYGMDVSEYVRLVHAYEQAIQTALAS